MKKMRIKNWKKYGFEFLSIFIAVISAFALNNWNENRKDSHIENKILTEISNGLEKDLEDIQSNVDGHQDGLAACNHFREAFMGKKVNPDSLMRYYPNLTRDFISIQNIAGYETLKSKGLELIENDSLRLDIISLYEYDYNTLRKLEEEYFHMQFDPKYFHEINAELAPNFKLNEDGIVTGIRSPLVIKESERNKLITYLWKIQSNRHYMIRYYSGVEKKINAIREKIRSEQGR